MVDLIRSGRTHIIKRQSCRVSVHALSYCGSDFVVVYDKQRKLIVTVLIDEAVSGIYAR